MEKCVTFVSTDILKQVAFGVLWTWVRVGVNEPAYLVMDTVEQSKLRICLDTRYLNLWISDSRFSLDKHIDVTRDM